ncbi:hypothetical protein CQA09_28515, partial [Klebsiella pneumoniae]
AIHLAPLASAGGSAMKRCWLWLFCLSWLNVVNAADYPGYQRLEPFQVQSADAQRSYQVQQYTLPRWQVLGVVP